VRKILPALVCYFLGTAAFGQPFGNEWINYSQRYYKIPVAEDGVYRITFNDLANAGIPISGINPIYIQMYAEAEEIPIYIAGESDGIFNVGDFIEFVGRRNTAAKEASLYPSANAQVNDLYSLYNDTLNYYLTWGTQGGNARISTETDQNFGAYTPATFVWKTSQIIYSNNYYEGNIDIYGVSSPRYSEGEGWMSPRFGIPQGAAFFQSLIPTTGIFRGSGAPAAQGFSVSAGTSNAASGGGNNHHLQIKYGTGSTLAINHLFLGYKVNRFTFNISNASVGDETTAIRHEVNNSLEMPSDYQAVAKVGIQYPHVLDMAGASAFHFDYRLNVSNSKTLFGFENLTGENPVIFTRSNPAQRIPLTLVDGKWTGLVPNSFNDPEFECFLATSASIKSISGLKVVANNGFFTNFGQTQIQNAFVIISHQSLLAAAQSYASYRQQKFNTVLVDVAELYDQFGYGVEKSGLSLRNFSAFLFSNWPQPPQYLLLIGKSIRDAREGNVQGARQNTTFFASNLVPSLGYPSSDNSITAGLLNTTFQPAMRTGRISARNSDEVLWYLDKLQTFESQPPAEWMKNVMHFGGGTTTTEQQNFAFYLSNYEAMIEDSSFGGNTYTYLKNSSAPIQINESQEVTEVIETGTSLMTFFGHATGNTFDQSIDDPQNFNWNGRYPLLLGNACYTGDYHAPGNQSTSELYTLLNGKGVIGFLASVKLGFEPYLNIYSSKFYEHLSITNYGESIGDHHVKTVRDIQFTLGSTPNLLMENTCLGMGFQGDPAVILNSFPHPDLTVTDQDVFFTPANITAEIDSFTINIVLTNIARGTYEPFNIVIEHETPEGGANQEYVRVMNGLLFKDTLRVKLPIDPLYGLGLHRFNVLVDLPDNQVEELQETANNAVYGKELLIANDGLVPVFPPNFAVVPSSGVTLKASTGNPLAALATYRMEIDTTDLFNSPALLSTEISQTGGIVEWTPALNYSDSAVFYWRARPLDGSDPVWRNSSFQYISEKTGWGQAHIFQFGTNNYFQTEFNRDARQIDFFTGTIRLTSNVLGSNYTVGNQFLLNTLTVETGACTTAPSIHLAVFDPITFQPWGTQFGAENPDNNFGNANNNGGCRNRVEFYFIYRQTSPVQMQALADLLTGETIPDGHYVLLYSTRYAIYSLWDATPDIYTAFEDLGAQMIGTETAQDSVPFSVIFRKGDPDFVFELYGQSPTDTLNNVVDIPASGNTGSMSSTRIGPANNWNSASWKTTTLDVAPGDSAEIRLIGIDPNGIETTLANGIFDPFEVQSTDLSALVSAENYPHLRMEAWLKDTEFNTPLQIDRWHVLYDPVPEAAVDPHTHYVFASPTLEQGQEGYLSVGIVNLSEIDMDSLLVKYWIEDASRNIIPLEYPRQDSLRAGQVLRDTVYFDTRNLTGANAIWVEVNPINPATGIYDQPEQTRFNNLMRVPFSVGRDNTNPILDVTFDGIHILNGEVISPTPQILIALKDENPYLIMDEQADTSLFKIFIASPGSDYVRYFFNPSSGSEMIEFIPATDQRNKAKVLFRPELNIDGDYRLLVQATDKSGNISGSFDYKIEFEVINRSTITEVLNYPNPFTTSTQFIFTLTGSEIPDEFKIQIMTVSGKVIREITQAEFGPIRIGRNMSLYRWDGHDEFGDRLANGVYLYRVFSRINGENIEMREGGASEYFTKGFGKMYLMR